MAPARPLRAGSLAYNRHHNILRLFDKGKARRLLRAGRGIHRGLAFTSRGM